VAAEIDFAALCRDAGDAIVIADAQGQIAFWNRAAERIFGYAAAEALGKSLNLIIPERFQARHWAGYRAVMESGVTRYGADLLRVPAVHKDGRTLSIAFTVCLVHGPERKPAAIAAFIRDESARWAEDRSLRRRVAELEGKTP
jgi:PAS domain S-box-containing protein